jgi:CDP-glycerol glycerophosphotransferase (TagB/SpsB family)
MDGGLKRKLYMRVRPPLRYLLYKRVIPSLYRRYAKRPVDERKVLFIERHQARLSDNFALLAKALEADARVDVSVFFLRQRERGAHRRNLELVREMATAKYIFINDALPTLHCAPLRDETVVTQTFHACGAFKKFGYSAADKTFGDDRRGMEKYPLYRNQTYVTVSSENVIWAYAEAMGVDPASGVIRATGVSRTDVFFDGAFTGAARARFEALFPQAAGKKVILYAPTFRGMIRDARAPLMPDLGVLAGRLSDEYVIAVKQHFLVKNPPAVPAEFRDFAFDMTGAMGIEELICVADICLSDYSSLIFEYSLFGRPMVFFAYDLDEYFDERGFYYDYHELTPGPVCRSAEEIADYIADVGRRFDREAVEAFREKFMGACDGGATGRILDMVFGRAPGGQGSGALEEQGAHAPGGQGARAPEGQGS